MKIIFIILSFFSKKVKNAKNIFRGILLLKISTVIMKSPINFML